jgi:hypothetical protein
MEQVHVHFLLHRDSEIKYAIIVNLHNCNFREAKENGLPGGEMVLSKTEGIVISITGIMKLNMP